MKRNTLFLSLLGAALYISMSDIRAQVTSCASFLNPRQKSDAVVPFRYTDTGIQTPLEWGLDVGWISEDNMRTGVFFAGKDLVDIVRVGYRPTESVEEGALSESQLSYVKTRADIVKQWCKSNVQVNINSDPGDGSSTGVNPWYNAYAAGTTGRGQRWAKCIDLHYDAFKAQGLTNIVSISPFNEPDYGWGQGYSNATRQADFLATAKSLREDYGTKYDGVRMCGGNTLNDDCALDWWTYLKAYLDEGNTHQLAGDFDHYAEFFAKVREAGHHATADELHNTMEAMVGVEYGLQTGIWWGTAEYTRSQFMKATYHANPGWRLGYAEHRDNWTAASVYRHTDGTVQGFGGTSERQAAATNFNFLSLDQPVWYDGERGRDYLMDLPGGTGYQEGQTNAETLVNIQGGDDVMPHIAEGTYKIVNVNSGLLMGFSSEPTNGWVSTALRKNNNYKYLQWQVTPNAKEFDYAYYTLLLNTGKGMYLDIKDWNYNAGADVGVYKGGLGTNEQWYLQYAGEGAFYIRSRFSTKCLEVVDGKTSPGTNIQMGEFTGEKSQQWKFLPTNVTPDQTKPDAPYSLRAEGQMSSIKLNWDASASKDVQEYVVLRNGYVLAKGLTDCEFTDNEAEPDSLYRYAVYAIDKSLNYSERSNETETAQVTDEKGEVMHLTFDNALSDVTLNGNHAAVYGETSYLEKNNRQALSLSGSDNYVQLPYTVASHDELSVSCWLCYRGGNKWQRVFDFGNGTNQYLFLTTNGGKGPRFAIKNGGDEEYVDAGSSLITNSWYHLVVTLGDGKACIYVNGVLKGTNDGITIKPSDIRPALNYIGRSQFASDPDLKAYVDDFVLYNYALSAEEVQALTDGIQSVTPEEAKTTDFPVYDLQGRKVSGKTRGITVQKGKKVLR